MAKEAKSGTSHSIPEGFEEQSADVVGFWDPSLGPITFVPEGCRLIDNSADATKVSQMVLGRLIAPCDSIVNDDEPVTTKAGDLVGVWAKPGMKTLAQCGGVPTFICENGTRDTGKVNPMTLFKVATRGGLGERLAIVGDHRSKSKAANDPLGLINMGKSESKTPF